jgi:hypothetical protein
MLFRGAPIKGSEPTRWLVRAGPRGEPAPVGQPISPLSLGLLHLWLCAACVQTQPNLTIRSLTGVSQRAAGFLRNQQIHNRTHRNSPCETHNLLVRGSNPCGGTKDILREVNTAQTDCRFPMADFRLYLTDSALTQTQ